MTSALTFTPYSTVAPLLGALPAWVSAAEQQRVASYLKYEEIFWSSEAGFEEVLRGDNENPIFLPTAKTLVNTVNRYTAPDFTYTMEVNPLGAGTDADVVLATQAVEDLFKRERFYSKFASNKRYGLIRGDWLWHILYDLDKPQGHRLSITAVDPAAYFPVYDEEDPEKIIKVHLAELITVNGQPAVSRLTYEKLLAADGTTQIQRSHGIFELDKWWEADKPTAVVLAAEMLPLEITSIPVYHLKNFDPNAPFGSSLLRGLESVLVGLNQSISDEDLALAMEGIGIFATDGRGPTDEQGNEIAWILGPGRVLTQANGLRRITGVTSVSPYGDHLGRLEKAAKESVGASDVAVGQVDGATAESGVAILLKLGPILALTDEGDKDIVDVHGNLFYDLMKWLAVVEELALLQGSGPLAIPKVTMTPIIGAKIPVNRKQVIDDVVALRNLIPPLLSVRTSHDMLRAAGLAIPDDEAQQLATEAAGVSLDPLAQPDPLLDTAADDQLALELA